MQDIGVERHWVASTITATIAIYATIASVVLSIAAAAMQYMQQQQQARAAEENQRRQMEAEAANQAAQMRAQDAAIAANAALANKAYMEETKQIQERTRQEDEVAAVGQQQAAVKTMEAKSTALTAAGEAGVSGLNVNALLSDYTRQEASYRFQSETQLGYQHDQAAADIGNAQITAEGRTQSMKPFQARQQSPNAIQYPSLLGAGLKVGADVGSQLYGAYRSTPQTPKVQDYGAGPSSGWASGASYE